MHVVSQPRIAHVHAVHRRAMCRRQATGGSWLHCRWQERMRPLESEAKTETVKVCSANTFGPQL